MKSSEMNKWQKINIDYNFNFTHLVIIKYKNCLVQIAISLSDN